MFYNGGLKTHGIARCLPRIEGSTKENLPNEPNSGEPLPSRVNELAADSLQEQRKAANRPGA
jgi:hypothetical protein